MTKSTIVAAIKSSEKPALTYSEKVEAFIPICLSSLSPTGKKR